MSETPKPADTRKRPDWRDEFCAKTRRLIAAQEDMAVEMGCGWIPNMARLREIDAENRAAEAAAGMKE